MEFSKIRQGQGVSKISGTPERKEINERLNETSEAFSVTLPPGWGRELGLADPFQRLVALIRKQCQYRPEPRVVRYCGA